MTFRALAVLVFSGSPALADVPGLTWPDQSTLTYEKAERSTRHEIATGPFQESGLPTREVDGERIVEVRRTPFPIEPSDVISDLKSQLVALGFVAGFDCEARGCGGFDFRYALDITNEPDMHVDLGNFHYLALSSPSTGAHVSLLASSSISEGYMELVYVEGKTSTGSATAPKPEAERNAGLPLAEQLTRYGSVALDDLEFASGSSALESNGAGSLVELAKFLENNETKTIVLVGHTDAAGSLEGNMSLSLQRAASVRDVLVNEHGVSAERLRAEGIGYLAPRASNDSPDGQKRNRRVEAVLETE